MSEKPFEKRGSLVAAGTKGGHSRVPSSGPSAEELLELIRNDPARGAPLFYDRFQHEVNRLVWRLLGADADHDDVVQQVFVVAFRRISQVRAPEALLTWVRTITLNLVYDEIRRRRVRRLFLRDAVSNDIHPSLVHEVEVRDFLLRAKRVLDRMSAGERVVFLLHVLEGKTLQEISELCRHSLATTKRRLARAQARFEKLVARDPDLARLLDGPATRRRSDADHIGGRS